MGGGSAAMVQAGAAFVEACPANPLGALGVERTGWSDSDNAGSNLKALEPAARRPGTAPSAALAGGEAHDGRWAAPRPGRTADDSSRPASAGAAQSGGPAMWPPGLAVGQHGMAVAGGGAYGAVGLWPPISVESAGPGLSTGGRLESVAMSTLGHHQAAAYMHGLLPHAAGGRGPGEAAVLAELHALRSQMEILQHRLAMSDRAAVMDAAAAAAAAATVAQPPARSMRRVDGHGDRHGARRAPGRGGPGPTHGRAVPLRPRPPSSLPHDYANEEEEEMGGGQEEQEEATLAPQVARRQPFNACS